MTLQTVGGPAFVPAVRAQSQVAPVGSGFVLDAGDLRFIYQQILVAQDHASGLPLLGSGPNQVHDPQLPIGLRTVDGSYNNLVPTPDQHMFGAADRKFPRLTTPLFRGASQGTSYTQKSGDVIDPDPRLVSNLIVDQSMSNPAAVAVATNPCGSGGFVCSPPEGGLAGVTDPDSGALFIPNITPDFGLSAPFNLTFTFFGQFFDHGLDLVPKGGNGNVVVPLQQDDPLFVPGSPTNFMVMARGTLLPGTDGIVGTADDVRDSINQTTPWVDQNQTYTSHPSHQVFLREYVLVGGKPTQTGKVLDGGFCGTRNGGFSSTAELVGPDAICNIGTWAEVKQQAATKLGILLRDTDVYDVPLILTDPYGHFKPGLHGFPQLVLPGNGLREGDPASPVDPTAIGALRAGHAFLNDIAHNADPKPGLVPDADSTVGVFGVDPQPVGTYDNELLDRHFATGDGRGNENIALSAFHNILHAEHNRLAHYIDHLINDTSMLTADERASWKALHQGSGWDYGERLFQAARFVTEMEYQHLVFEEFGRRIQPLINPFLGGLTSIDPAISAEFAHTVYRLGHSMLPETIDRINADGSSNNIRLLRAFLNPLEYNNGGSAGTLTADKAMGAIIRGTARQIGNELDEFTTSSVRNTLLGLPLDLPAINIARGRSEGIPPLNQVRTQFFNATRDAALKPYANWVEFGQGLRHIESLVNFIAAYGTHSSITTATTVADKRAAAQALINSNDLFLRSAASTSGLNNVDFWVGGLAEKPSVFGGLLGTTFNFVFEIQLERLQDGDRFYYLQRTDGLNLRFQLEGNSLAEIVRRNSDMGASMDILFSTADFSFEGSDLTGTAPINLGNGIQITTLEDGTKLFFDPLHTGKNIVFNGTNGDDRFKADVGDDSLYGNAGNDRLDGNEGNDTLLGGEGDDILFGGNGDDVIKGGPGNDAIQTGPGFGGDLAMGAEGNDFMVGGDDGVEYFGAGGNDVIVDGSMRSEGIFGGDGDDWLYDGDGHDGGMFGDDGNVFDLLAGLSAVGGDDVEGGGPGQDNHFGEGGDDIFLMSEGSNKFFGDYGFDWITQRGWPAPGDIQLNILAIPGLPLNFNDLRNFYRFTDGASGWDFDDHIVGDENTDDPAAPPEIFLQPQMALTVEGAAKVTGLETLITSPTTGFGQVAPNTPVLFVSADGGNPNAIGGTVKHILYIGGNVLLGGKGSDTIEGRGGNDLIDGDRWLNVQLVAHMTPGTTNPDGSVNTVDSVKRVDSPVDLVEDVFADPQRINPGNITIERTIVSPNDIPAPDCGAQAPLNCDTVVFSGPAADYSVDQLDDGRVIVTHLAGVGRFKSPANDGTDTLRNIERLQFSDGFRLLTDTALPVISASPNGSTLNTATSVALASNRPGGTIFFTLDGSTPTTASTQYTGPIALPLNARTTLSFFGVDTAGNASIPTSQTYVIDTQAPVVSAAPLGGTFNTTQNVTISATDNNPGAASPAVRVFYTTNGTVPTTSSTPYNGLPLPIAGTTTLSYLAVDAAGNQATGQQIYTITNDTTAPVVTASPLGGTFPAAQSVSLSANETATIFFTTNGTAPTTASPQYSGPIAITANTTLRYLARDTVGNVSAAAQQVYKIDTVPPTVSASPLGGSFVSAQSVTLTASDNNPGSGVFYTVDGTVPTSASTPYTGPIAIGTTTALKFIAVDAAGNQSAVGTQTYTIAAPPAGNTLPPDWLTQDIGAVGVAGSAAFASPTFMLSGGGADIWGAADAFRYAYTTLNGDGQITARVSTEQAVNVWTKAGVMIRESVAPGSRQAMMLVSPGKGNAFQRRLATNGVTTNTAGALVTAPYWVRIARVGNTITASQSANGSVWNVVGTDTITFGSSVLVGLGVSSHSTTAAASATFDSVNVETLADTTAPVVTASPVGGTFTTAQSVSLTANEAATIFYTVDGSAPTTASTQYAGPIAISATTTLRYIGRDTAGNVSNAAQQVYTINVADTTAPVVTASPVGGTFTTAQSVTLTANESATMFYTVNGSAPTTASTQYTGPIAISATTTLRYIGRDTAGNVSTAAQQVYTINSTTPDTTAPVVTASPVGGTFTSAQSVTLSANEAATIFYTVNGSAPTTASTQYTGPIAIGATTTLRYIGRDTAGNVSAAAQQVYTITTTPPGALPAGWLTQDIGAVGVAGNASFASPTYTVTGGGADIWGTADALRYAYTTLNGDGQITARVATEQAVNVWTKAGVMIRDSVAPGSRQAMMLVSPGKGNAFQRRVATGGVTTSTAGALVTAPYWVRIARVGNTITASQSANGTTWTVVGTDTIAFGPTVQIGLGVSSHSTTATAAATFDNVLIESLWANQDIGAVGLAGSTSINSGVFTVTGAGADIWGTADAFHFTYQRLTGDGQITARVNTVSATNVWHKVGVMLRNDLTPGSAHATMFVSSGKGLAFQRRVTAGGVSTSTAGPLLAAPRWVRIARAGSLVTASYSNDGTTWTVVGTQTMTMGTTIYVGLANSSHTTTALGTATIDSVVR